MKLKKWELALIIAVVLTFICGAAAAQGQKDQQDLADKLVRLHVVANSDSDADQALKLKVRDKILEDVTKLLDGVTDRDKAVGIIEKNMQDIVKDAGDVIRDEGYDYAAKRSHCRRGLTRRCASSSGPEQGTTGGASSFRPCA